MLYTEFMNKVEDLVLDRDDNTGLTFIRPDYMYTLKKANLDLSNIGDFDDVTYDIILEHLKLKRDMLNTKSNKLHIIADWIYDIITTTVNPIEVETQNELFKNMLEYEKEKNKLIDRKVELEQQESVLESKSKVLPFVAGMNFSKKKP